jgi:hypothetical protein
MSYKIQSQTEANSNNGMEKPKTQMSLNFPSVISMSLLTKEICFSSAAALGGLIVLIGLWMEYVSTDESRYESVDIKGFRKLKSKEKRGEQWVMWGIFVEIAVAVTFAALDVKDKHDIDKQNKANAPTNQQIGLLTASVSLFQTGTNRSNVNFDSPLGGKFLVRLRFRNSAQHDTDFPFELVCTSGSFTGITTNMVPGKPIATYTWDGLVWDLEFEANSTSRGLNVIPANATVQDALDLDSVEFDALFLQPDTDTDGGEIILTINSTKKIFKIPPQKVLKPEEVPLTKEDLDKGVLARVVTPKIDKTVTLFSWAHKK